MYAVFKIVNMVMSVKERLKEKTVCGENDTNTDKY